MLLGIIISENCTFTDEEIKSKLIEKLSILHIYFKPNYYEIDNKSGESIHYFKVSINDYERINKARWYNFVTGFNFDSSNDAELNQGYYTTEQLEQAFLNED